MQIRVGKAEDIAAEFRQVLLGARFLFRLAGPTAVRKEQSGGTAQQQPDSF